jgi:hypothetical protein
MPSSSKRLLASLSTDDSEFGLAKRHKGRKDNMAGSGNTPP